MEQSDSPEEESTRSFLLCLKQSMCSMRAEIGVCERDLAVLRLLVVESKRHLASLEREVKAATVKISEGSCSRNSLDAEVSSLIHEAAIFHLTRMDGSFLWKIDRVNQRRSGLIASGVRGALVSIPFYTDSLGYKMCCKLHMGGCGSGLGTHLSVYLVLMKSEWAPMLDSPFTRKFAFTLINQDVHSNGIRMMMTPAVRYESSDRSEDETSVTVGGCSTFVEASQLDREGFVKYDVMYVHVEVYPVDPEMTSTRPPRHERVVACCKSEGIRRHGHVRV